MARHNELGTWGEETAKEYLIAKGYTVAHSNWKMHHYELDMVAFKDDRVVFIEVKTRSTDFTNPVDAVNPRKIHNMVASANAYIDAYDIPHEVQFDIIGIVGSEHSAIPPKITHVEDAFYAPMKRFR